MYKIRILLLIIFTLAAVIFGTIIGDRYYLKEKIIPGHYIGKAYVGGMTREKALRIISTYDVDQLILRPISLFMDDGKKIIRYEFKPSQIGASVNLKESVDAAISNSHKEAYIEQLYTRIGYKKKVLNPCLDALNEVRLINLIKQISEYIDSDPVNAKFIPYYSKKNNKYTVSLQPEKIGKKVKIEETAINLKNALWEGKFDAPLVIDYKYPQITSKMLNEIPNPTVIGTYTTFYGTHDSPNRIHNIYLVSSFVDNTFLKNDETFSLLSHIGKFNKERGFKEAYVIMGNELVAEYGGGTCQIATTLYNSVMMADLKILQRQNHGIYFSIYPLGRDATVYPPYVDFKFKNNTGYPILIDAHPFKKGLTFRIFGTPSGKRVFFTYPKVTYRVSTITTFEEDSDEPVIKKIWTGGFSTSVTKIARKDGEIINRGEIRSFYKMHGDKQKVKIRKREPR